MINISTEIVKIGKLHKKISNSTSQVIHPETEIAQIVDFPEVYNNSGKFLTTDGSELAWATVTSGDSLPSQTGNSGKYLTTNGTTAAWSTISSYTLPIAASDTLGGIKVGTNLSIDSTTGVLSATDTTYSDATTSTSGLMSATDKTKLDGLSNYTLPTASDTTLGGIKVGTNLSIDSNGILSSTDTVYTHPTTSGNKHIPSGGASGNVLTWSADGTAVWGTVDPLPSQTNNSGKFLTTDGTDASWASVFSGNYNDLSNKPTIPTVPTDVSEFNNDAGYITGVAWEDVTGKPSTFAPATHNHDSDYTAKANSVGSGVKPIYTNSSGALTASTSSVGDANTPVYLKNGEITTTGKSFANYATLASPALTGTPTAPTATAGTNTTQIATTAFVNTAVSNLVNSAPSTLDTLNELAAALGNDPNFATTVATSIGEKLDSNSANYVKSLSISGTTLTVTAGDDTTSTLTTQDTVYTHPTTAGNKHIPSGGSSDQFLSYSASGTAQWTSSMTAAIAETGTETTSKTISAKVLNDKIVDMRKNNNRNIEFIVGTQTAATNKFTGVSEDKELYDGKTIFYYLPYDGTTTSATLNLTLSTGATTGAKAVYLTGATRIKNQYAAGSVIHLTYMASTGTWRSADYGNTTNTYDRTRVNNTIYAAESIAEKTISVSSGSGYKAVASGVTFDLAYPILYLVSAVEAQATSTNFYLSMISVDLSLTKSEWTGTENKIVFLVGTISGNTVTIDSSVFTTTVPSTTDGKVYIPIGIMYSTTQCYFYPNGQIFEYKNGAFRPYDPTEVTTSTNNGSVKVNGTDVSVYTHPTTAGNKHIPSGGSSGQILQWSDSGTATWANPSQYTLPAATTSALGGVIVGSGLSVSNGTISADSQLPTQTGNNGKFLTTDGSTVSWSNVDALPSQTNNSGKFLTTNGTTASWSDILNEIKVSSIHYPTAGDNTITLTSGQSIPNNVNKYTLSIYRNGIYLNSSIDYGFNSSTGVITFTETFDSDEVITVVFTYINTDSQVELDLDVDEYEAGDGITFTNNPITNKVIISADDQLPDQTSNSGKFLTTNGTATSWATVDALPAQTNNSGKFLTTNGTTASWSTVDALPSQTGNNGKYLTTNGSTASWTTVPTIPDQTNNAGKILTTDGTDASWEDIFSKYTTININSETYTCTIPSAFLADVDYGSIVVYLDGVRQLLNTDYSINTTTGVITFVEQLLVNDIVTVGIFSTTAEFETVNQALSAINNQSSGILVSDGSNLSWKNFTKLVYVQDTTTAGEQITVPLVNLADAVITEVYRNGLLMVNPDDYTINTTTGDITFVQSIIANEKIVVITQKAIVSNIVYNQTATTQATSDNSNNVATTAFVTNKIASYNYQTASDVTTAINNRFANPIEKVNVIASAASITIDPNSGSLFMLSLSTNSTISIGTIANGPYTINGATISLYLNNTNSTISWDSTKITWMSGSAPDVTTNPSIVTFITFNGGTTWYGSSTELTS